jgi:hypothetical protein
VLLIHGWNIIEPRIDFGLGLREVAGKLRSPAGAHISASDAFIRGPVTSLAARLRLAQIHPTFGLRYPGAAAQNLLQGFTARHGAAESPALQRLAAMAAEGVLNALQLEMSVALRLPGTLRQHAIDAITETFSKVDDRAGRDLDFAPPPFLDLPIIRQMRPVSIRKAAISSAPLSRVGIEFYDPAARLGGMVSFDFGGGAAGGRIMILFDGCRVALFTAEGLAERVGNRLSIGSLILNATPGERLRFRGPAVIVDDGTAYLSVERALSTGRLDPLMEVDATLAFTGVVSFAEQLTELDELLGDNSSPHHQSALSHVPPPHAIFGRIHGTVGVNRTRRNFDGNFRLGASFTGLGPQKFVTRRMIWASFGRKTAYDAVEARVLEIDNHSSNRLARISRGGEWANCDLAEIQIELDSQPRAPESISAALTTPDGSRVSTVGRPGTFVMLSRPGPDGTRLHTCLGFAEYYLGDSKGAGMYEFSRRIGIASAANASDDSEAE